MAEPQSIDLRWNAPPGCPLEGDVREQLQKLLGSGRQDNHLRADGTITRMDKRFRLDLVVQAKDLVGTRSIESDSCADLAGAAAVQLGLLIRSAEEAAEPGRPAAQPPTLPPTPETESPSSRFEGTDALHPQEASATSPVKQPPNEKDEGKSEVERKAKEDPEQVASQRAWRALLQAPILAFDVGPLPQASRGWGVAIGLDYASWQLQLKAAYWLRQSVPAPGFPGYGADIDRVGATFWGCRELRVAWFGLSPCLTVGLDRTSVRGSGRNIAPSRKYAMVMTAGAGAQGRIHLTSWLALLASVGGQVELFRPQISIGPHEPQGSSTYLQPQHEFAVYQFTLAVLSAAVGVEWIF
jgi:hypothetical protein